MRMLTVLFALFPSILWASECVVIYNLGKDEEGLVRLRKGLEGEGVPTKIFEAEREMAAHLRCAERINEEGCQFFIALYARKAERECLLVGIHKASLSRGLLRAADEIQQLYVKESERVALSIPSAQVVRLPLFPLLGIKMPGLLLYIRYSRMETLDRVAISISRALGKKGERR